MRTGSTIALGAAFLVAGCQPAMSDDQVEILKNAIRSSAEQQGLTVKQLDLAATSADAVAGSAIVFRADNPVREVRWDCNAQRGQGTRMQWRCAPSGQALAGPAPAPSPAPVPAPAPAPVDERAEFAGRWTETGDCSNVTALNADGTFVVPDGGQGNWDVEGSQLTLTGPNGSATAAIYLNDANTMLVTTNDGNTTTLTRC